MLMTECEIVGSYRRAVRKSTQIRILSELNACDQNQIRKILADNGIETAVKRTRKNAKGGKRLLEQKETENKTAVDVLPGGNKKPDTAGDTDTAKRTGKKARAAVEDINKNKFNAVLYEEKIRLTEEIERLQQILKYINELSDLYERK